MDSRGAGEEERAACAGSRAPTAAPRPRGERGPAEGEPVIEPARAADLAAVLSLLDHADLPRQGLAEHFADVLVARRGDCVVGAVGLERYGESALLRSLVVAPAERGRGLGRALTLGALRRARAASIRRVFLLTTTAAGFFLRFGFVVVPRDAVDPAVHASAEFQGGCCASAVAMRLTL